MVEPSSVFDFLNYCHLKEKKDGLEDGLVVTGWQMEVLSEA